MKGLKKNQVSFEGTPRNNLTVEKPRRNGSISPHSTVSEVKK